MGRLLSGFAAAHALKSNAPHPALHCCPMVLVVGAVSAGVGG